MTWPRMHSKQSTARPTPLTIASVAGKRRTFKLTDLAHEIRGVKVTQKKGKQMISPKLVKKEEK